MTNSSRTEDEKAKEEAGHRQQQDGVVLQTGMIVFFFSLVF
uniref:Uncharacterized protein n=1 Tax=Arundo donax TaxID=35708 RepID=A0A0A9GMP4_ARUDO